MSKYLLAQESGMSPQMIAYVENGDRNPTLETTLRIAKALGVDLAEVITKARKEISEAAEDAAAGRAKKFKRVAEAI